MRRRFHISTSSARSCVTPPTTTTTTGVIVCIRRHDSSLASSNPTPPAVGHSRASQLPSFPTASYHLPPTRSQMQHDALRRAGRSNNLLSNTKDNTDDADDDKSSPPTFSRAQGDPWLYHGVSPENMKYLYDDERQALLRQQEDDAVLQGDEERRRQLAHHRRRFNADIDGPRLPGPDHISHPQLIQEHRANAFLNLEGETVRDDMRRRAREADEVFGHDRVSRGPLSDPQSTRALATERTVLQLLESGAPDRAKAEAALELAGTMTRERLPVRARIVEEVFALWTRVTNDSLVVGAGGGGGGGEDQQEDSSMNQNGDDDDDDPSLLSSSSTTTTGAAALLSRQQFLEPMSSLYFHLRGTHASPTPKLVEHFMTVLHLASGGTRNHHIMNLANRLMLDSDRFSVLLTRVTYATFFDVCALNNCMDIALVKFADAKKSLFIEPDSGMVRSIASGLLKNGLVNEALAFYARTSEIVVDLVFLNTVLEVLVHADDPMSAFTAFRSLEHSGVVPNSATFYQLLRACEASGQWEAGVPFVLAAMQKLRVKGDDVTLNLLLKGLLLCKTGGMGPYAHQLYFAMKQKGVDVMFPDVEDALPAQVRQRGAMIEAGVKRRRRDRLELSSPGKMLEAARNDVAEGASAAAMIDGRDEKSNSNDKFGIDGGGLTERDVAVEKYLRHVAANGNLSARSGSGSGNNNNTASLATLCIFCVKRRVGSFELQDKMRRYLRLRKQRSWSLSTMKNKRATNRDDLQQDKVDDGGNDELRSLVRSLRPVVWKEVHKFFYGVAPVSTRVIDVNRGRRGGGRGRSAFQRL